MTDRSDGLVDKVARVMADELDEHGYEDDDEKRWQVARHFAQAAIDAMQLTRQTRETWPSEESGVSGPLHETCWQTPWVVGDD